ncbi:gp141 [Caviid betaherpesvirus 2]|uniref:Gp141 n=2 Tax=Caviid betaherpesvirus 2 TaxID=33706 RepID=U6HA12_9BETA|nr:gp141 [Caviid betaherpesvirus 2]AGE11595.1 gp141 [Caviid betaherpesvirus 2]AIL83980.1 gp141 [BAC cloning vector GPN13BACdenovo_preserved(MM)]BAJ78580.1 gp141 [Caviid betaherpesvirus 2]CDI95462.1 gp141 [Caviid herpesvirus 2 str. CIDMTR]
MWRLNRVLGWERMLDPDPRYYYHASRDAFLRVMTDFKELFVAQDDPEKILEIARRRAGEKLSLGIPHDWFLELTAAEDIPQVDVYAHECSRMLCCVENLSPLGHVVVRETLEGHGCYRRTKFVAFMGAENRLYFYHVMRRRLLLIALHIDHLARYGLIPSGCFVLDDGTAPVITHYSAEVYGILERTFRTPELVKFLSTISGVDVELHTPGVCTQPLKLLSHFDDLRRTWPFCAMPPADMEFCSKRITFRLRCLWFILGAVGAYHATGFFHTSHVLVVDRFGAVYALVTRDGCFYRVADNVWELFKGGLNKCYSRRCYDFKSLTICRLERPSVCRHHLPTTVGHHKFFDVGVAHDYEKQHQWLCRDGRFREDETRVWDDVDSLALWKARVIENVPAIRDENDVRDAVPPEEGPAAAGGGGDARRDERDGAAAAGFPNDDSEDSDRDSAIELSSSDSEEEDTNGVYVVNQRRLLPPGSTNERYTPWQAETDAQLIYGYFTESEPTMSEVGSRRIAHYNSLTESTEAPIYDFSSYLI